jgi:GT2 family glycosyltransferase
MNSSTVKSFAVIIPAYNAAETIVDCVEAVLASTRKPNEVIIYHDGLTGSIDKIALAPNVRVVANPGAPVGPARGRNVASRQSTCDVLIFVDADVIVAKDAFCLLLDEMERDAKIWAAFGSYDHAPRVTRVAALYANLRHHWVHQNGEREAVTFWSGLGAVRREAFCAVGGFDEAPVVAKIEDIELGTRLIRRGGRIRLVPTALGTHCKDWTITQLWRTDIFYRAIPWALLLARGACVGGHLNGANRERWSALFAYLSLFGLTGSILSVWCSIAFIIFLLPYLVLNRGLLQLMLRRGGAMALLAGVVLHWIYHMYASATYVVVKLHWLPNSRGEGAPPMGPIAVDIAKGDGIADTLTR